MQQQHKKAPGNTSTLASDLKHMSCQPYQQIRDQCPVAVHNLEHNVVPAISQDFLAKPTWVGGYDDSVCVRVLVDGLCAEYRVNVLVCSPKVAEQGLFYVEQDHGGGVRRQIC
jgi:hypothetical protein